MEDEGELNSKPRQAGYDATVSDYRQLSLTAFQEVEDNLSTLRILESEQAKQHEAVESAQNSEQLSLNRYKGGLVTYLEVITAQTIALTNERTEMDLLRRRMDASVQLIRALVAGWDVGTVPSQGRRAPTGRESFSRSSLP